MYVYKCLVAIPIAIDEGQRRDEICTSNKALSLWITCEVPNLRTDGCPWRMSLEETRAQQ